MAPHQVQPLALCLALLGAASLAPTASFARTLLQQAPSTTPKRPSPATAASAVSSGRAVPALINGQPLCSPAPVPGLSTVASCDRGYLCVPLSPSQILGSLGSSAAAAAAGAQVGVCAYAPAGLALPAASVVPAPMAFFPLNSPSLEAFPLGDYKAINHGTSIVADPVFGGALRCRANDSNMVALDPVPYGAASGAFAVNLWARPANLSGPNWGTHGYVLSHQGTCTSKDPGWGPNQVQLYLLHADHPAHGLARAYVRDSNDFYHGYTSESFIDSDGAVNRNGARPAPSALLDGNWHMLTLTSQPGGDKGYVLYIDGKLAAQMNATTAALSRSWVPFHVDGGDPLALGSNIILCSRSDDPSKRHFDGDLAYLSLWDSTLTANQVAALYAAVLQKAAATPAPSPGVPLAEQPALSTRRAPLFKLTRQTCGLLIVYHRPNFWRGLVWLTVWGVVIFLRWIVHTTIPAWTPTERMRPATLQDLAKQETLKLTPLRRTASEAAAIAEEARAGDEVAGLTALLGAAGRSAAEQPE